MINVLRWKQRNRKGEEDCVNTRKDERRNMKFRGKKKRKSKRVVKSYYCNSAQR